MKKLRKNSQLKELENSPERTNNDTDLCILTNTKFKKEIVKIPKELRVNMKKLKVDMNSNADYFIKELENMRRSQKKIRKFIYRDTR